MIFLQVIVFSGTSAKQNIIKWKLRNKRFVETLTFSVMTVMSLRLWPALAQAMDAAEPSRVLGFGGGIYQQKMNFLVLGRIGGFPNNGKCLYALRLLQRCWDKTSTNSGR